MALNVYLMPAITEEDPNHPGRIVVKAKYLNEFVDMSASQLIYGEEPAAMVICRDVASNIHTLMGTHSDVTVIPDLAQNIGAQLIQVQTALDNMNVPSQWVQAGFSYGSVCRYVAIFLLLMERWHGLGKPHIFGGAVNLGTRYNQLGAGGQANLEELATSFSFDLTGLRGTHTLREILKGMADQFSSLTIFINGEAF